MLAQGSRLPLQSKRYLERCHFPSLDYRSCRSGWPSRGSTNGVAVPSIPNERSAFASLNCACRDDTSIFVYAFEYDDQGWKANDNERSFGISGKLNFGDIFASC
jgi:hypothetical protein